MGHQARHHPAAVICYAVPASPEPELLADVQVQPSDGPYVVCYAASLILLGPDFLQQTKGMFLYITAQFCTVFFKLTTHQYYASEEDILEFMTTRMAFNM